ncbi:hypothetical protein [Neobacillus sp. SuZ13]|uniref:hypothetical protein n=1 Tax=Neobacillus sp. SuZ13 TaxID=3047875 RepID=UPI0024BFCFA1|nr:hypothetical protein [Neobacillus sp. SuZ13]WHY66773.1 hypothetical protein QNH17_27750 [Neobacillus sp. SuZ13]
MKKLFLFLLILFSFFPTMETGVKASVVLPVLDISTISVGDYSVDFSLKNAGTDFDGEIVLKSGKTILGSTYIYSFSSYETILSNRNFNLNEKLDFYFVDEEGNETFLISELAKD